MSHVKTEPCIFYPLELLWYLHAPTHSKKQTTKNTLWVPLTPSHVCPVYWAQTHLDKGWARGIGLTTHLFVASVASKKPTHTAAEAIEEAPIFFVEAEPKMRALSPNRIWEDGVSVDGQMLSLLNLSAQPSQDWALHLLSLQGPLVSMYGDTL